MQIPILGGPSRHGSREKVGSRRRNCIHPWAQVTKFLEGVAHKRLIVRLPCNAGSHPIWVTSHYCSPVVCMCKRTLLLQAKLGWREGGFAVASCCKGSWHTRARNTHVLQLNGKGGGCRTLGKQFYGHCSKKVAKLPGACGKSSNVDRSS